MNTKAYTAVAAAANKQEKSILFAVVQDVNASDDTTIHAGGILVDADAKDIRFVHIEVANNREVIFTRAQYCGRNISKAYKYLSDYTLDRRPLVHLESGALIENPNLEVAA